MNTDNILNALEQSEAKRHNFLEAWKQGVERLGPELFGPKTPEAARVKSDLKPLREKIDVAFVACSGGEKQLLSAMVSFFDPEWGEDLAARTEDEKCICGLTFNMDHAEIDILCTLLRNYEGWE